MIPFCDGRKDKYFRHGKLDWDPDSTFGRSVRSSCKPLEVLHPWNIIHKEQLIIYHNLYTVVINNLYSNLNLKTAVYKLFEVYCMFIIVKTALHNFSLIKAQIRSKNFKLTPYKKITSCECNLIQ